MSFERAARHLIACVLAAVAIVALSASHKATAVDADVDPAWHGGAPFRLSTQSLAAVAQVVDPDGSTFVVGSGMAVGFFGGLVTKLDSNGNLDAAFGGTRALQDANLNHYINDVGGAALQGDGLIIVGAVAFVDAVGHVASMLGVSQVLLALVPERQTWTPHFRCL